MKVLVTSSYSSWQFLLSFKGRAQSQQRIGPLFSLVLPCQCVSLLSHLLPHIVPKKALHFLVIFKLFQTLCSQHKTNTSINQAKQTSVKNRNTIQSVTHTRPWIKKNTPKLGYPPNEHKKQNDKPVSMKHEQETKNSNKSGVLTPRVTRLFTLYLVLKFEFLVLELQAFLGSLLLGPQLSFLIVPAYQSVYIYSDEENSTHLHLFYFNFTGKKVLSENCFPPSCKFINRDSIEQASTTIFLVYYS